EWLAVGEAVNARVLQEAADYRLRPDVVGQAGHARPQAADAADHKFNGHACSRGIVKGVDDVRVDQRVAFQPYAGRKAVAGVLGFLVDHRSQLGPQVHRRDGHVLELIGPGITGDVVENAGDVARDARIGREE